MATAVRKFDCLIFGGGLAGSVLAWTLIENGKRPLVVDKFGKSRCSQVAAGLINPVGGKRLNLVWEAEKQIHFAQAFYQRLEAKFNRPFFTKRKVARLFSDENEQSLWDKKKDLIEYQEWTSRLQIDDLPNYLVSKELSGMAIKGAGIVKVPDLIERIHRELDQRNFLERAEFGYEEIKVKNESIAWNEFQAPYAAFAEGHLATENPWFKFIPYRPAKGVIGRIETSVPLMDTIIIQGKFLIPNREGSAIVGATYDWESRTDQPDLNGIEELESFLRIHLGNEWKWQDIHAGVRPTIPGAMPAVGPHPEFSNLFSFNGFGSKGATQAPILAKALYEFIWHAKSLPKEITPIRFRKDTNSLPKRWIAVEIARDRVLQHLSAGDTVIDATTGNGHDTLWLAQTVGPTGTVYAFDIQDSAIEIAKDRLASKNTQAQIVFRNTCHSHMAKHLPSELNVKAIVFNLGYLPEGDKSIITRSDTTVSALNQCLTFLQPNGIVSLVIYPGHQGGDTESDGVLSWAQSLDRKSYATEIVSNPSGNLKSPYLLFVQKVP